jgi:hypothetical protein
VILQALSKRKEARFDSVLAFAEALEEAMSARERPWTETETAEDAATSCPAAKACTVPEVRDWAACA